MVFFGECGNNYGLFVQRLGCVTVYHEIRVRFSYRPQIMKNTTLIGNVGLAKTIAKFVELDVPVYTPFGEGYITDIVADFNGKLNRIQIKTTENLHDDSYMVWKITHQEGFHGRKVKYTKEEVDYFALYCIETNVLCLVPFDNAKTNEIVIRLDSYEGIRTKVMRFVSEYKFENFIKTKGRDA